MALKVESKEWYRQKLIGMLQKGASLKSEFELELLNKSYRPHIKELQSYCDICMMVGRIHQRLKDLKRGHLTLRDEFGRFIT